MYSSAVSLKYLKKTTLNNNIQNESYKIKIKNFKIHQKYSNIKNKRCLLKIKSYKYSIRVESKGWKIFKYLFQRKNPKKS